MIKLLLQPAKSILLLVMTMSFFSVKAQMEPDLKYTGDTSGTSGGIIPLHAFTNSTGAISYSVLDLDSAYIENDTLYLLQGGIFSLYINIAADTVYNAKTIQQQIYVDYNNTGPETPIVFYVGSASAQVGSYIVLGAYTNSSGAISYSIESGGTGAGYISHDTLFLTEIGEINIGISVAADNNYLAGYVTQTLEAVSIPNTVVIVNNHMIYPGKNEMNTSINTYFSWSRIGLPNKQKIIISTDSMFTDVVVSDTLLVTEDIATYYLQNPLSKATTYYWKALPYGEPGIDYESDFYMFKTKNQDATAEVIPVPVLNLELNNNKNVSLTPLLKWSISSPVDYFVVIVAGLPVFNDTTSIRLNTKDTQIRIPGGFLISDTKFYLTVIAYKDGKPSDPSVILNFITNSDLTIPESLIRDIQIDPVTIASINSTVTINWPDVAGAESYCIQISSDPNFETVTIDSCGLEASQYSLTSSGNLRVAAGIESLPEGTYFWRVAATNEAGNTSWSETAILKISSTTAITNKEESASVNVYPNPSDGKLHVTSSEVILSVELMNALGHTEFYYSSDITTNMSGIVLVKIQTENGVSVKKVWFK